jgi:hypothetical protein
MNINLFLLLEVKYFDQCLNTYLLSFSLIMLSLNLHKSYFVDDQFQA